MTKHQDRASTGHTVHLVYDSVRERILHGDLAGGRWLRESDLATTLGVSRTPVREAFRRLAAEGLVRYEPNRGVQVQTWQTQDLEEIFGLRALLEPWGSRLAAERGLIDVDALTELAIRLETAARQDDPDFAELTDLNNRFHGMILAASGTNHLHGLVASVVRVPLVSQTYSFYSAEDMERSLAHHRELIAALVARDGEWAESTMRAHLRAAWACLKPHLPPATEASGRSEQEDPADASGTS